MKNILVDLMLENLEEQYEKENKEKAIDWFKNIEAVSIDATQIKAGTMCYRELSFEETRGQIIKRLRQAYQQLDIIRYDLEVWNDAIDELLPKGIEKLAFEVENIVDRIEDIIRKMEVM